MELNYSQCLWNVGKLFRWNVLWNVLGNVGGVINATKEQHDRLPTFSASNFSCCSFFCCFLPSFYLTYTTYSISPKS